MDRLDDALEILDGAGPEYGGGLANHGPMAAEALFTLEQAGAVVPWTERYRRKLGDEPAPGRPVERAAIRDALGQMRRYPDWLALFLEEFREGPWEPAVDRWVYELAPGFAGAATHGVIRAGHAARSLARHDTPGRRKELARGFAYWAATHQTLPRKETSPAHLTPDQALAHVPRLPDDVRRTGSIAQGLKLVATLPDFPGVISLVDAGTPESFVPALGETFARVFLAGTTPAGRTIALIHAVTGPAAAGLLVPHVSARTAARLLGLRVAGRSGHLRRVRKAAGVGRGRSATRDTRGADRGGREERRRARDQVHGGVPASRRRGAVARVPVGGRAGDRAALVGADGEEIRRVRPARTPRIGL